MACSLGVRFACPSRDGPGRAGPAAELVATGLRADRSASCSSSAPPHHAGRSSVTITRGPRGVHALPSRLVEGRAPTRLNTDAGCRSASTARSRGRAPPRLRAPLAWVLERARNFVGVGAPRSTVPGKSARRVSQHAKARGARRRLRRREPLLSSRLTSRRRPSRPGHLKPCRPSAHSGASRRLTNREAFHPARRRRVAHHLIPCASGIADPGMAGFGRPGIGPVDHLEALCVGHETLAELELDSRACSQRSLDHGRDSRVERFDQSTNHGPFFAHVGIFPASEVDGTSSTWSGLNVTRARGSFSTGLPSSSARRHQDEPLLAVGHVDESRRQIDRAFLFPGNAGRRGSSAVVAGRGDRGRVLRFVRTRGCAGREARRRDFWMRLRESLVVDLAASNTRAAHPSRSPLST